MATAFTVFKRWLACRRTTRELALFSDRDLADLGLVRSDLIRIAARGPVRLSPRRARLP